MTLSEMLTLLTFLVAAAALIVEIVNTTFNIAWKISHDKRQDENNKSE